MSQFLHQKTISIFSLLLAAAMLLLSILACDASTDLSPDALQIGNLPQYVCPSATPRATNTPLPTSFPTYPYGFNANLRNYQVGANLFSTTVQWVGQNAGSIYVSYSGSLSASPYLWQGATQEYIGYSQAGPALSGAYTISFPSNLVNGTVRVWSSNGGSASAQVMTVINIYPGSVVSFNPPPYNSAPPAIYPTPRPTYTPYPSPTPYIRNNDYFLGDAIYTAPEEARLRVRFRLISIEVSSGAVPTPDPRKPAPYPMALYVWTFKIKNTGSQPFTFFPPAQSFIAAVMLPGGAALEGAWQPSYQAAEAAGIGLEGYDAFTLRQNQETTVSLAAYAPQASVYRVSWAMDATQRSTAVPGQPTAVVSGSNIVSWLNQDNTICRGEIQER